MNCLIDGVHSNYELGRFMKLNFDEFNCNSKKISKFSG